MPYPIDVLQIMVRTRARDRQTGRGSGQESVQEAGQAVQSDSCPAMGLSQDVLVDVVQSLI